MDLTEEEKAEVKGYLDRGEPLPDTYRFRLFREPREAELIWPGKTHEVTQAILPFQSIEQIDEPRTETSGSGAMLDLFSRDAGAPPAFRKQVAEIVDLCVRLAGTASVPISV